MGPSLSRVAAGVQSSLSRETLPALGALNEALWSFFIVKRWQVKWESNLGGRFVLGASGTRMGSWQELARIDSLRVTVEDDEANACWEQLSLGVPAFQKLAEDSNESSRKSRGNVVEACVGASFLASYELAASRAPAAFGATIPRFRIRTEPPEALAHAAAIFRLFMNLGVSSPAVRRPDPWDRLAGVPAKIRVAEPDAAAGSPAPQQ